MEQLREDEAQGSQHADATVFDLGGCGVVQVDVVTEVERVETDVTDARPVQVGRLLQEWHRLAHRHADTGGASGRGDAGGHGRTGKGRAEGEGGCDKGGHCFV